MAAPIKVDTLLVGDVRIFQVADDPTTGAGVAAPVPSIALRTTGSVTQIWVKNGVADTAWELSGTGGAITIPPVTAEGLEDAVEVVGNVFDDASTTSGTLSIITFQVFGVSGIFQAGETASIGGVGTFSLDVEGNYELIPALDWNGVFPLIMFQATNGSDLKISTLSITLGPVNDPPVARDDARVTLPNTPITIDVLSTDYDPDDDTITITHFDGVIVQEDVPIDLGDGVVTYLGGGEFLFEPALDFGLEEPDEVTFQYTIHDGTSAATATVTIRVGAENIPMMCAASPVAGIIGEAAYNFGLTFRGLIGAAYNNGVNVSIPPYSANQGLFTLVNREPWLYDRATTCYALYLRTRDPAILADAFMLADTYMAGVSVSNSGLGTFTIAGGDQNANAADAKYLYPIVAVWYEREKLLAGESAGAAATHRNKGIALYRQILLSHAKPYSAGSAALWTERLAAFAISGCTAAFWLYRMAGNISAANVALQDAWDYFTTVETMSASSGAPLHGHNQHEGSAILTPVTSPWMCSFLMESCIQLYRTDPDDRILEWIAGYGDFMMANGFYATNENDMPTIQGLRLPAYLVALNDPARAFREGELLDMEHAADVSGIIKMVIWAKTALGSPWDDDIEDFQDLFEELEFIAGEVFEYWTRTTVGYPRYRNNPPRKYAWWFRNNYSDVNLFFTEQVPTNPLNLVAMYVTGSTQQGEILTAHPGTWDAFPAAILTYQWQRNGEDIDLATEVTYQTQVADEGTAVTCIETATNDAGALSTTSNTINVVAAGAPEITDHPDNDTATVGGTATFIAICDADPAATWQWQINTGGGWVNVEDGDPVDGAGSGNTASYTTEPRASGDDGDLYRCVFTNINGSATTNTAQLSMVIDQGAARFNGGSEGASWASAIGAMGMREIVLEALVYFEDQTALASWFGVEALGRYIQIQCRDTVDSHVFAMSTSGGTIVAWATQPPLNTWLHVTIQCESDADGSDVRATWTEAEDTGATRYAVTGSNEVEEGIDPVLATPSVFVGGEHNGPPGGQGASRFQYVRGRTGYLADGVVDGHRQDANADPATWTFWWRFFDDGGNLGVEDLTGNNNLPTIEGGTYSSSGPVVPTAG